MLPRYLRTVRGLLLTGAASASVPACAPPETACVPHPGALIAYQSMVGDAGLASCPSVAPDEGGSCTVATSCAYDGNCTCWTRQCSCNGTSWHCFNECYCCEGGPLPPPELPA